MRTTINIDEHLLKEAREVSVQTRRSLSEIVEEGVRIYLGQRKRKAGPSRVSLVTFGQGGLQPGVDLDDSANLLGIMEDTGDPV